MDDLATLLTAHMDRQKLGDQRLATLVEERFGPIVSISRATIRNWRDGSSQKVADWRQLLAVAALLQLSSNETDELLRAAQLPTITTLSKSAGEDERKLFDRWMTPAPVKQSVEDAAQSAPKVFISYSHDSTEHSDRAYALANRLRSDGIDCHIDQFENPPSPPEGWPLWMERQIAKADFVLVVCTPTYLRRFMGQEQAGVGHGVRWESLLMANHIYTAGARNTKLIPVLFNDGKAEDVPRPLQGATRYWIEKLDDYERLYRHLTNQPNARKSELGRLRTLPPHEPNPDFFTNVASDHGSGIPNQPGLRPDRTTPAPPFILPRAKVSCFTGREAELRQLEQVLLNPAGTRIAGIAGVTGTGGMGKSALAFHFAQVYREHFPDGVIGLRVDGSSSDTVARRFARHAGVDIDPEQEWSAAEIMQSVFQHRRALLIFDNADAALLKDLHPGGASCAVIVTTRNQSLLQQFDIPKHAQIHLPRFSCKESCDLLREILRDQRPERVDAEPDAICALVKLVGGLPLALRIVGATLYDQRFTTISQYLAMLHDEQQRLASLRDRDDPDLNVRASFELSLRFLDEAEITIYASLGACAAEGFSLLTAQVVSDKNEAVVRHSLGRFVRLSLLEEVSAQADRFVLHPLLHLFARKLGKEKGILAIAEERHTRYFQDYAHKHRELSVANVAALDQESAALFLTAWRLLERDTADYDYYLALAPFFETQGYWQQALNLVEKFVPLAERRKDFAAQSQFLLQKAQFLRLQGKLDQAEAVLREAEPVIANIDDHEQCQRALAMVLKALGVVYRRRGHLDAALNILQQSQAIAETLGDEQLQAQVLNSLGGVYRDQRRLDAAVEALERSQAIAEARDDKPSLAQVLNSLGGVYRDQGRLDAAVEALERSAALEAQLENRRGQAMVLNSLGGVYRDQRRLAEAVDALQRSLALVEALDDARGQAMVLNSLGGVYRDQGRLDAALAVLQRSQAIAEARDDKPSLARVLNSLGGVYRDQGRWAEAVNALQRSIEIGELLDDQRHLAQVLNSLSRVYRDQGRLAKALAVLQRSIEIGERLNDQLHLAIAYTEQGRTLRAAGNISAALEALRKGFVRHVELADRRGLETVTPFLVRVLIDLGQPDAAQACCTRALEIVPDSKRLLKVYTKLTKLQEATAPSAIKRGRIKRILRNAQGASYGFIAPEDGGADIYFQVGLTTFDSTFEPVEQLQVEVEVAQRLQGLYARSIKRIA